MSVAGPLDRRTTVSVDIDPGWYEGQPETADEGLFVSPAEPQGAQRSTGGAEEPSAGAAAAAAPPSSSASTAQHQRSHVPTVLTKLQKWGDYASFGEPVWPTKFIPMKTPLSHEILDNWQLPEAPKHRLTVSTLLEAERAAGRRVGLLLDLSNHDCLYDVDIPPDVEYLHVQLVAKELPPIEFVREVGRAATGFWARHPDQHIAIHCAYGFNRTGFVVCSFLIEHCGLTVDQALHSFASSRPPGVKHEKFKQELWARYGSSGGGSSSSDAPLLSQPPSECPQAADSSSTSSSRTGLLLYPAAAAAAGATAAASGAAGAVVGGGMNCSACASRSSSITSMGGSPAAMGWTPSSNPGSVRDAYQIHQQQQQQLMMLSGRSPPAAAAEPRCCCCQAPLSAEEVAFVLGSSQGSTTPTTAAAAAAAGAAAYMQPGQQLQQQQQQRQQPWAATTGTDAAAAAADTDVEPSCSTSISCFARNNSLTAANMQTPPLPPPPHGVGGVGVGGQHLVRSSSRNLLSSSPAALRLSGRCWSSNSMGDNSSIGCSPSSSAADLVLLRSSYLNTTATSGGVGLDANAAGAGGGGALQDDDDSGYVGAAAAAAGASSIRRHMGMRNNGCSSSSLLRGDSGGACSGIGACTDDNDDGDDGCGDADDSAADEDCFQMDPCPDTPQHCQQQQQQLQSCLHTQQSATRKSVSFRDGECCEQPAPGCSRSAQQLHPADLDTLLASVSITQQQQQVQQEHVLQQQQQQPQQYDADAADDPCSCSCHSTQQQSALDDGGGGGGSSSLRNSGTPDAYHGGAAGSSSTGGGGGSIRRGRLGYYTNSDGSGGHQQQDISSPLSPGQQHAQQDSDDLPYDPAENESFGKLTSADLLKSLRALRRQQETN